SDPSSTRLIVILSEAKDLFVRARFFAPLRTRLIVILSEAKDLFVEACFSDPSSTRYPKLKTCNTRFQLLANTLYLIRSLNLQVSRQHRAIMCLHMRVYQLQHYRSHTQRPFALIQETRIRNQAGLGA